MGDPSTQRGDSGTIKLLDDFAAAYNRHDVDGIMRLMTEDCVFCSFFGPESWGERFVGAANVRVRVASFLKDFPDAKWSDVRHFASGDRGVTEWIFTGTRRATGERAERHGCDVFTLRDNKIYIKDTYQKWRQVPGAR